MYEDFSKYLTLYQYNIICKYWNIIEKINSQLEHFDYSAIQYRDLSEDEEEYEEIQENNNNIINFIGQLQLKIEYYEKEYEKHINKFGFKLNDITQDEKLFNLLNNGIEINI